MIGPLGTGDHAVDFLIPYLSETERLGSRAVEAISPDASFRIRCAADLCLPHDVMRLAGGFATGILVQWTVPDFVPVDICMNTDLVSVFYLSSPIQDIDELKFSTLREWVETKTLFDWNFHKGNHFISYGFEGNQPVLVMHSNEKEFKYQSYGLAHTPGNWYSNSVKTTTLGERYLRYLEGKVARDFFELAKMLEPFSIIRHRIIASQLAGRLAPIKAEWHKFHYYMPSPYEAALGCYLCEPGERVIVLSRPGSDLQWFVPSAGGTNGVILADGSDRLLVPHGWGKTMRRPIELTKLDQVLTINDVSYEISPTISLGKHPDLQIREFEENPSAPGSLYSRMQHHCPGDIVGRISQHVWYCGSGFGST